MLQTSLTALLFAGISAIAAADQTTTIFFPATLAQSKIVASVLGTHDATATLELTCPPEVVSTDCIFSYPLTVTAGPSAVHYAVPTHNFVELGVVADCTVEGTTTATCVNTYSGIPYLFTTDSKGSTILSTGFGTPTATGFDVITVTTTEVLAPTVFQFVPITVTAGPPLPSTAPSASLGGSSSPSSGGAAVATAYAPAVVAGMLAMLF